ncbi:MAG: tetratricopeptide repeat protein [Magnetococcales bacterium]|nr:tetratricopeptide repeat protein [Magnetococcales bacterium]
MKNRRGVKPQVRQVPAVAGGRMPVNTLEIQKKLAEANLFRAQNQPAKALALCEEILAVEPQQLDALFLSSNLFLQSEQFVAAKERIERALLLQPNSPVLLFNTGLILFALQEWAASEQKLRALLALEPQHQRALFLLGQLMFKTERWEAAVEFLHRSVEKAPEHVDSHLMLGAALHKLSIPFYGHYHQRLGDYYAGRPPTKPTRLQHTFFLQPERALQSARAAGRVQETIQKSVLQVCYYLGDPLPEAPKTAIGLPPDNVSLLDFFTHNSMTHPEAIDFDPANALERAEAKRIVQLLYKSLILRSQTQSELEKKSRATAPAYGPDGRLRVFIATSRKLDVMLTNSYGLQAALQQLGCEVFMAMEQEERQSYHAIHFLQQLIDFHPQVVIDINNYFKLAIHPDVYGVYWYQDPMPILFRGKPLPWRPRDLLYSLCDEFTAMLHRCGAGTVHLQGFCYDQQIFRDYGLPRKRKIVFVGSAHDFVLKQYVGTESILARMWTMVERGEMITPALLDEFAASCSFPANEIFLMVWSYVVRKSAVRWLCEIASSLHMEVVIYGRGWEADPAVAPYFKGPLTHGKAVADAYNEAEFALVCQGNDLQSQRLVEVAACGATPVVYDCRYCADPPHWDDECLWFRTREQLLACLNHKPAKPPFGISQGRTYLDYAQHILQHIPLAVQQ